MGRVTRYSTYVRAELIILYAMWMVDTKRQYRYVYCML